MTVEIEKLDDGKYSIVTHTYLIVSAQDLRDIYDWCLLHMREIEAEAAKQAPSSELEPAAGE